MYNSQETKQISLIYKHLVLHNAESNTDRLEAWKSDIQENIEKTDWEKACIKAQKQILILE